MESNNTTPLGLLKIKVIRGIKLAVRDLGTSDPYVVITMEKQTVRTRVIKKNCNPEWNEDLTLTMRNLDSPIHLTVFDKDRFTVDDKMGEAVIDIKPYIDSLKMGLKNLPNGCVICRSYPNGSNCLSDESCVVWNDGKITQNMRLRLKNVECGELDIQLEWVDAPGCKGLEIEGKRTPWMPVGRHH